MNVQRRGVWIAAVLAPALLLGACAPPVKERRPVDWSYVRTKVPAFWWYGDKMIDVPAARAKGATGAGRIVAIVDTGVLSGHEDLPPATPGLATCGTNSADTSDRRGHGTQLAGIVVGKDKGAATQGVAPAAALVPIKVDCGVVTADSLTRGVDAAIARNAEIVLLALGAYPPAPPDVDAFMSERADRNPGILFVVASIWDGSAAFPFPSWTRRGNVVVVAAMTLADGKGEVPYSARAGDLWAPGRDVETASIDLLTTTRVHDKFFMQGTSAASAIVAGCAALVKQKTGHAGARLKDALIAAAEPKPELKPGSNRRLNCGKAVP